MGLMPKSDPKLHHRHSTRLKGYDYSQAGAYFVTAVAWQRENLFGEIVDGEMRLNRYGEVVEKWWDQIPVHFPTVETGAFVIMPNHSHGIVVILDNGRGGVTPPLPPSQGTPDRGIDRPTLGQIMAYFKYQSTKEMNSLDGSGAITKFWQRNYHDRIIRSDTEMARIWDYIEANPANWGDDMENPPGL